MNRETIEKAANERRPYTAEECGSSYMLGKNVGFKRGFMDGAHWRINTVLHDVDKELPEYGRHVVNEDWFDFVADDEKDLNRIMKKYPFKRWAYIDDLLPDGKEVTE